MEIVVKSGSGIETATKLELKKRGIDAPCENGSFIFDGSAKTAAELNLNLRTADRVLIRLKKFKATTFDELFDNLSEVAFENILARDAKIIVNAKSVKSELYALSSIQSISKKAICIRMLRKFSSLPETGAPYYILVEIINNEVNLLLDTSGDGLHKRGYRDMVWQAPIKETIAAGILQLSIWNPEKQLIDPFCGSGTFAIEAAMKGLSIAPGLYRSFAMENYGGILDIGEFDKLKSEAAERIEKDRILRIAGFDIDKRAIRLSVRHAKNFGLEKHIHFETADMRTVSSRFKYGVMVANPPYGERMTGQDELKKLYRDFGAMFSSLDAFSLYCITAFPEFERYFGRRADKKRRIYNARIECCLYRILGERPPHREKGEIEDAL